MRVKKPWKELTKAPTNLRLVPSLIRPKLSIKANGLVDYATERAS